jgi:uncharacterized protein YciI
MRILLLLLISSLLSCRGSVNANIETSPNSDSIESQKEEDYEYRTYYLGFLKRGISTDQDSLSLAKIQKAHLAHMDSIAKLGKLCIAGPFLDDWDTRGIVIYSVDSLEEAKGLAEADPAVKAGRLAVEIHPWMSARGSKLP